MCLLMFTDSVPAVYTAVISYLNFRYVVITAAASDFRWNETRIEGGLLSNGLDLGTRLKTRAAC